MSIIISDIRVRIAASGLTQESLADLFGYSPSHFSRIIRGKVPMPDKFELRLTHALDLLEGVHRDAEEARKRVLAEIEETA